MYIYCPHLCPLLHRSRLALRSDRDQPGASSSNVLPELPERTQPLTLRKSSHATHDHAVTKKRGGAQPGSERAPPSAERQRNTGTAKAGSTTNVHGRSSAGKRKYPGHRSGQGSRKGGRGEGGAVQEETPEQHAAKNLNVFEKTLADLHLPAGVTGNRRWMLYLLGFCIFFLFSRWCRLGGGCSEYVTP